MYAHGGGFVFCDLDSHDGLCRDFANLIPAVVVSVGYRLAPENPWPAAAEDIYAVDEWAADNADALGGDPARRGRRRQRRREPGRRHRADGPRPRRARLAAQLLLYPVIAADFDNESYRLFGKGFYNPKPALQWYWDQYVPSPPIANIRTLRR